MNSMKKILFLTNMYPSHKDPSYGIFVKKTYEWLKEEYEVTLVKICRTENSLLKVWSYLSFYFQAIVMGCLGNFDCVYAHYISHCALPIRFIRKIKKNILIIGNIHGEDVFSEYEEYKKNKIKSTYFINNGDYIISPSEYYKSKLCKDYAVAENRVFVSPSGGIDTTFFRSIDREICRKKIGLEKERIYIGYVSRIEKGKGWDIFIRSVRELKEKNINIYGIIVGYGSEMKDLKQFVEENNISERVVLFPLLSHDDLVYVYNSMDLFCFPSSREAESLGLVGLEAMACEIPCIITNNEGPSSYAKDGYNCLQFDPHNETELEEKILELLNMDIKQKEALVSNARKTALLFDKVKVKDDFNAFFKEVL